MHYFFHIFTPQHPYLASIIKFVVLGTLGEYLGAVIRTKNNWRPFPLWKLLPKMLIWGILGLVIKWAFSSFVLLIPVQAQNGLLPEYCKYPGSFFFALAISVEMNLLFAPFMMALHRALDNISDRQWNWKGMHIALYSIAWFWIPAHTITFLLPTNYRIFFAALLGVILGVIMGYACREK